MTPTDTAPSPLRRVAERLGLLARRCVTCGVLVHGEGSLCEDCKAALAARTGGFCTSCGHMWEDSDSPPTRCGDCRVTPPPWDHFHFHGPYEGLLRKLILDYKFGNDLSRTRLLGQLASDAYARNASPHLEVLVPVPLHPLRLLRRGFNQSLELGRDVGRRLGVPVAPTGLERIRNTTPQSKLALAERRTNIKDAFAARPEQVSGKRVLLVDDVYTTGATLRECARTLAKGGASAIEVLVIARTAEQR